MSSPIKAAIASYGMSGKVFHAPLLDASEKFILAKILERNKEDSRSRYPESLLVRSFRDLCVDDSLELIVVNTPDDTHFRLVKMALESGKHVVVEKPFTLKYHEAFELSELADRKGLVLSVFQNRRWDGDFLTIQKLIRDGLLGRLVSFESHFDRYRNFNQSGTWKEDASSGTGTLYNLGSHMIDQALVLFGHPISVFADIRAMRTGSQVDDSFDIWMEYPEVSVLVRGSLLVREQGPRYILHGTEGSFLKWGTDPQEEALKAGKIPGGSGWGDESPDDWGLLHTNVDGKAVREKYPTLAGNYQAYYDNIFAAIRFGESLAVPSSQGALVIRVIEAAFESHRLRRVVGCGNNQY